MQNVTMMYMRPANLFKEFEIKTRDNPVGGNGRPTVEFISTGRFLFGCLADAESKQKMEWKQMNEMITHTIIQSGRPKAAYGDQLILEERIFDIKGVEDISSLGVSSIYYVEERVL